MPKNRFLLPLFLSLALGFLVACGGNQADEVAQTIEPTTALEVVSFQNQQANTATPVPSTNTPEPMPTSTETPIPPTATPLPEPTATPEPIIVRAENENPLTGLVVDPVVFTRRPVHVRIGNDSQARPQVNLSQADLVYEEIVEWWITRFTAVYYGQAPEVAGPIRSARLVNGQLTKQYNAALVNSGGSDGVRWELSQQPITNLDEYFHPRPYFYREGEPWQRRLAVNIADAHQYMNNQGLQNDVELRGFAFDAEPVNGNPAETIYINYPSKDSKVLWRFNADSGEYDRYVAGEPALDATTNQIISVPNVIIYFAPHFETDIVEDSTGATSVRIEANGEGKAWIFRDRTLIEGRWRTDGSQTPEFIDFEGKPIPLRPGRSWIQIVPLDYTILVNETP